MLPHRIHLHGPWEVSESPGKPWSPTLAPIIPHSLPTAKSTYRRRFSWPRPVDCLERVQLVIDGVLRPTIVFLNRHRLGEANLPWLPTAFDVTALLEPKNLLELEFHDDPLDHAFPHFFADKGVREGVYLSIESRLARWKTKELVSDDSPGSDSLIGECESEEEIEGTVRVEHQRDLLASFPFKAPRGKTAVSIPLPSRAWSRWNVRSRGMPHRVKLEVTVMIGNQLVHQEKWETGLLSSELSGSVNAGGSEITPERAYAPNVGYPADLPVAEWDITQGDTVILHSFVGPRSLYSLMDRIGLCVMHRGLSDRDLSAVMEGFRKHPCIQAGKA